MNEQNPLIAEISRYYNALSENISKFEPSDATTEAHQHLMKLRELMISLNNENDTLKAFKKLISCSQSINVEKATSLLKLQEPQTQIRVLDKDASRDDMLAISKIDQVEVVEVQLDPNIPDKTKIILLHKGMNVDWLPKSPLVK